MHIRSVATIITFSTLTITQTAHAQTGGSWGWGTDGGAQGNTYGPGYTTPPVMAPPSSRSNQSSDLEIGTLYGVAATYGVGMGIWIDAETGIDDPGLRFVPPIVLGLAAPVGVYFLDNPPMPRGMPAAIASGMIVGAGEGLGIWSYQFTTMPEDDAWGFRGLSRAMTLGGAVGGGAGFAMAYFQEPSPKSSLLLGSAVVWGSVIGSMVGYGSTEAGLDYGEANDGAALGGLIGYNVGLGAAAGLSAVYVPAWESIGWMWIGGGIGAAAGLPIYLAYAGSDKPAKRGLIIQGITTGLGIVVGGIFSSHISDGYSESTLDQGPKIAEITGFGLMPTQGGAGLQVMGTLF
ncbi:MAG TPA: hypothetical protein PLJ27_15885 [Polyangiaceae bacterium]|nr:hypothetical protein [Polyangiaceae bacterium]HNZ22877.1 hypothetical protein [Polyangiaceae bacterium]HOD21292.1 hypothetical protein [Polyangiaceae bacterium]HOE48451.1 hypothetical protein [Polyangiaceae bacterium]HOH00500.1 hypothetical protein [Polyangiaceae bacterium]